VRKEVITAFELGICKISKKLNNVEADVGILGHSWCKNLLYKITNKREKKLNRVLNFSFQFGQPARYLLAYLGIDYEEKRYESSDDEAWFPVKFTLGLDFPNVIKKLNY